MSMAKLMRLVMVLELDLVVRPMEYGLTIWGYHLQVVVNLRLLRFFLA